MSFPLTTMSMFNPVRGPSPPPEYDEPEIIRTMEQGMTPEMFQRLVRKFRSMPRGSAGRKTGVSEIAEGGKRFQFDRYGNLVRRGFEPNRRVGPGLNFLNWMAQRQGRGLERNLQGRELEQRKMERERGVQRGEAWKRHESEVAQNALYNRLMQQNRMALIEQGRHLDKMALEQQRVDIAGAPKPMSDTEKAYMEAQTDLLGARKGAEEARAGYLDSFSAYRQSQADKKTGAYSDLKDKELMNEIETAQRELLGLDESLTEMRSQAKKYERNWLGPEILYKNPWWNMKDKPVDFFVGGKQYGTRRSQAARLASEELPTMRANTESRLNALYDEADRRGMPQQRIPRPGRGRMGTGGAPGAGGSQPPSPAGLSPVPSHELTTPAQHPRQTAPSSEASLKDLSWSEGVATNDIYMPSTTEEFMEMDEETKTFYSVMQRLEAEGYNIRAVPVINRAIQETERMLAGQ